MADHSKPTTTSTYANFVSELDGRLDDISLGLDPATTSPTNLATNSIRWTSASNKWQKYNGTTWADLSSAYSININGTVGATTPASGAFTTLSATGNVTLGDASGDTVTINGTVGAGVVISGSTATDALRITQTGAGNALVVEDDTNPDSSQFVVDSSGNVGVGTSSPSAILDVYQSSIGTYLRAGTSSAVRQLLFTSSTTTNAGDTHTINASSGSGIIAFATSSTEAMRIRSDGNVSIGGSGASSVSLYVQKDISGATSYGVLQYGQFQSGVTNGYSFNSSANVATGATLTALAHFRATEGIISGSMTSQYGFVGLSDLISATNNYAFQAQNTAAVGAGKTAYGFYSGVNTATGGGTTYGFYAAGTANNYFAGNVGIGVASPACALDVTGGIQTSRTAVTSPASTDGNIFSGTYTPTLTNTTNVAASSAGVCQYMRVGNVVTVSGQVDIDPTATGDTIMGVSLPIASNLTSQVNCGGTFISLSGVTFQGGSIYGDSTNDRATFRFAASSTANFAFQFTFTYRVI